MRKLILLFALLFMIACVAEVELVSQAIVTFNPTPFRGNITPDPLTRDVFGNITQGADTNRYNGYYNEFHMWIPGVVKAESQFLVMPDLVIGEAWGYGVGRGIHTFGDSDVVGTIVLPFCSEIGNYVWAKREGCEWEGPFRVVDCAARYDIYNVVVNRHEVAEIPRDLAIEWNMWVEGKDGYWGWNMRKIQNVLISKINPECLPADLQPVKLDEWFKERVTYFETKEEGMQWEEDNPRGILTKNIDGIPQWRINGEWIIFPRNSVECE